MKFYYRAIPKETSQAIRKGKGLFSAFQAGSLPSTESVTGQKKRLIKPHPLFYLGLLPIVTGHNLSCATAIGWRHVAEEKDGFSDVTLEHISDRKFRVSRIYKIPKQHISIEVHRRVQSAGRSDPGKYEVRALTVPPLVNLAIWLQSSQNSTVIPIYSVVPNLPAGKLFTEKKFLKDLIQPARELLEAAPKPYIAAVPQANLKGRKRGKRGRGRRRAK